MVTDGTVEEWTVCCMGATCFLSVFFSLLHCSSNSLLDKCELSFGMSLVLCVVAKVISFLFGRWMLLSEILKRVNGQKFELAPSIAQIFPLVNPNSFFALHTCTQQLRHAARLIVTVNYHDGILRQVPHTDH